MTIIPEEEFEESLRPNGKSLYRNGIQSLKVFSEHKKLKLKKQINPPNESYVESSEGAWYVQSSEVYSPSSFKEDPYNDLNSGRMSEEFILKMIDKYVYK